MQKDSNKKTCKDTEVTEMCVHIVERQTILHDAAILPTCRSYCIETKKNSLRITLLQHIFYWEHTDNISKDNPKPDYNQFL